MIQKYFLEFKIAISLGIDLSVTGKFVDQNWLSASILEGVNFLKVR
jgi:hypothetical protein